MEMRLNASDSEPEVLDKTDVFNPTMTYLAIETPLDRLFAEHRKLKQEIEAFSSLVKNTPASVLSYFFDMPEQHGKYACPSFDAEPAIKALDARFWVKAMGLTDVRQLMPAATRHLWDEQVMSHKTPAFEESTVRETLRSFLADRSRYFAERVDGVFRALSGSHVTNSPVGFGKRMIMEGVVSESCYTNYRKTDYIEDLRVVIGKFYGDDTESLRYTDHDIQRIVRAGDFGVWKIFDGGAFRLKVFKKGTVHLEVNPSLVYRMNQVLSWLYPNAIPDEHRRKPKAPPKDFPLDYRLVSNGVLSFISNARFTENGRNVWSSVVATKDTLEVLKAMGGVVKPGSAVEFDYDVRPAFDELRRVRRVPDEISHQFYPTPENLVDEMLVLADVSDQDQILEPSAGHGAIAKHLPKERLTCVEISSLHAAVLQGHGLNVVCTDFLQWEPPSRFSLIMMNPPFSRGRAVEHVKKAASLLAPGGRLVAILPGSARNKEIVPGMKHCWSQSYSDQFAGTKVTVVILLLTQP